MDERRLEEALAIHEAAYGLLKWLNGAIERGFVAVVTAHLYVTEGESAAAWIAEHYENIPHTRSNSSLAAMVWRGTSLLWLCGGSSPGRVTPRSGATD